MPSASWLSIKMKLPITKQNQRNQQPVKQIQKKKPENKRQKWRTKSWALDLIESMDGVFASQLPVNWTKAIKTGFRVVLKCNYGKA